MSFDYSSPKENKSIKVLRPLAKLVVNTMFNLEFAGKENIPNSGSFIIASNHIQYFDPVIISVIVPRAVHFMAKSEVFENGFSAFFLKALNSFPVKRERIDRAALGYAKKIIDSGWLLGIFPEGRRSKDGYIQNAKNGLAYLAQKTNAAVLPVSIYKTPGDSSRRPRVTVRFGKLISNSDLFAENVDSSLKFKNATEVIMNSITELWNMKHGESNG